MSETTRNTIRKNEMDCNRIDAASVSVMLGMPARAGAALAKVMPAARSARRADRMVAPDERREDVAPIVSRPPPESLSHGVHSSLIHACNAASGADAVERAFCAFAAGFASADELRRHVVARLLELPLEHTR